jgi:hypothetical protein
MVVKHFLGVPSPALTHGAAGHLWVAPRCPQALPVMIPEGMRRGSMVVVPGGSRVRQRQMGTGQMTGTPGLDRRQSSFLWEVTYLVSMMVNGVRGQRN